MPSLDMANDLKEIFKQDLPDMIKRLEEIKKMRGDHEGFVCSISANRLMDESYYCYLHANFLASIVMLCNAFEALLRQLFPNKGIGKSLKLAKKFNIISPDEYCKIKNAVDYRNNIVHMQDDTTKITSNMYLYPDYETLYSRCSQFMKLFKIFNKIQRNPFCYSKLIYSMQQN